MKIIENGAEVFVSLEEGKEFSAIVLSYNVVENYYVVEDQDGDVFCADEDQINELV